MIRNEKLTVIQTYLCCGCSDGGPACGYPLEENTSGYFSCKKHRSGTFMAPGGRIALGLPKGFNKVGPMDAMFKEAKIRIYPAGETPTWDKLNIPVWAIRKDGHVFVRTFMPRLNIGIVEILLDRDEMPSGALDVGEFIDDID